MAPPTLADLGVQPPDISDPFLELETLLRRHERDLNEGMHRWLRRHSQLLHVSPAAAQAEKAAVTRPSFRESAAMVEPSPTPPGWLVADCAPLTDSIDVGRGEERCIEATSDESSRSGSNRVEEGSASQSDARPRFSMGRSSQGASLALDANDVISSKRRSEILARRSAVQRFVGRKEFDWAAGALVLLNVLLLGVQVQMRGERALEEAATGGPISDREPLVFDTFHVFFLIVFSTELALRWTANGLLGFLFSRERWWNVLDIAVVSCSFLDLLLKFASQHSGNNILMSSAPAVRIIRVVRVMRVMRAVRVMRLFRELRLMILAILRSMRLMCWACMVLGLLLFIVGVCIASGTIDFLEGAEMWQDPGNADLISWFSTLDRAMVQLYMAMSGGRDWGDYYEALAPMPGFYRLAFLAYMSFSFVAVVNVVTGVFVDSALQSNQADRELVVQEEIAKQQQFGSKVRKVFEEMDMESEGRITLEDFERRLNDEHVIAYFNALKLDVGDAKKLFMLLDSDSSGEIDVDEFLTGCQKLQGESRALDTALMQMQIRMLSESLSSFRTSVDGSFASLRLRLDML